MVATATRELVAEMNADRVNSGTDTREQLPRASSPRTQRKRAAMDVGVIAIDSFCLFVTHENTAARRLYDGVDAGSRLTLRPSCCHAKAARCACVESERYRDTLCAAQLAPPRRLCRAYDLSAHASVALPQTGSESDSVSDSDRLR